jgi:hypothetical protein
MDGALGVVGVSRVVGDVVSNSQEFAIVSPYELPKSRYVSILRGIDKVQIVACHSRPCESCLVCSHIHSVAPSRMAKGMVILNKVPVALLPSRQITPPWSSTNFFAIASPNPLLRAFPLLTKG